MSNILDIGKCPAVLACLMREQLGGFEFCINFTVLDILLGIPNYGKNKDIDILNFVILFAKYYIYSSKRDAMAIDFYTFLFYTFLVKLKTRMLIEEYRCNICDKHVEIETMWARLADSV